MRNRGRPRMRDAVAGLVVAAALLPAAAVIAQPAAERLLVFDVPYGKVWASAVRETRAYAVVRAADGVIETARVERAPLPEESAERVAERITIRVEVVAEKVTRVTVTVEAEGLRDGRWQPLGGSPATARSVLGRIRAGIV